MTVIIYCPKHGQEMEMKLEIEDYREIAICTCGITMVREWTVLSDDED